MERTNYLGIVTNKSVVGGYNDLPPNMERISHQDFINSGFFNECWIHHETRQPCDKTQQYWPRPIVDGIEINNMQLYWFEDGSYIAIVRIGFNGCNFTDLAYYKGCVCKHEYGDHKKLGNCWYQSTCKKCVYVHEVDSSD